MQPGIQNHENGLLLRLRLRLGVVEEGGISRSVIEDECVSRGLPASSTARSSSLSTTCLPPTIFRPNKVSLNVDSLSNSANRFDMAVATFARKLN